MYFMVIIVFNWCYEQIKSVIYWRERAKEVKIDCLPCVPSKNSGGWNNLSGLGRFHPLIDVDGGDIWLGNSVICGECICRPRSISNLDSIADDVSVVVKMPRYEILSICSSGAWCECDILCASWCIPELLSFCKLCEWFGYMLVILLVLLISSLIIDDGLLRSSFNELQMLWCGLDTFCGSKDKSSDSIEPDFGVCYVRDREKEHVSYCFIYWILLIW